MKSKFVIVSALLLSTTAPAFAAPETVLASATSLVKAPARILDQSASTRYQEIFAAIRNSQWAEAATKLDTAPNGPLTDVARAELYLAKGSPMVTGDALAALAARAPDLPQSSSLARLANARGVTVSVALPSAQELSWLGSAPRRSRLARVDDGLASAMASRILPLIKDNRPNEAEAIIDQNEASLGAESRTEWQQRVAWSYYITGDDEAALRLGAKAQAGSGEWAAMGDWVVGLSAWRRHDYARAAEAFASTARRAPDEDMVSAANFWAARSYMAANQPQKIDAHLKAAGRNPETFYGMLALQQLGISARPVDPQGVATAEKLPNVRAALALSEIGETALADQLIRHQAKIGDARNHAALAAIAGRLDLPATQLWLAHNGPRGSQAPIAARYPMPRNWVPDNGWKVDKSLVFAHTLQESQFRTAVVSHAGARGLMQVLPGTAAMLARNMGETEVGSLTKASTNLKYGQAFLELLRDNAETGGMLPKVIAAYNAGPTPVATWNARMRDNNDPLLYIESIPYWETRAYVTIIMRNYWMYQTQSGAKATSLAALAQGMWPRFPGLPGATAVRLDRVGGIASAD